MPPKPTDVLGQARSLIEGRLKELDDERRRLEGMLSDITGGRVGRRRPGRPRGWTNTRRATGRKRGRRRSTRADQAVKHVQANPGITASEIAKKMRIKPNYVYRVMGDLQKQGKVRKKGKGYVAA
jgi:DNA invertase Pin-like site-specific DNA recombinase